MTDKKDDRIELNTDILVADVMLRITALEKLLIEKGVFTQAELSAITDEIAKKVAKVVLEKAKVSKNIEEFVATLEKSDSSDKKDFDN
jgi:TPP-dependent pyruvate/acetoin dehydrogenase alpha subunit